MSEMPDEREITKQQLWQRIDDAIQTFNLIGINITDNTKSVVPQVEQLIAKGLEETQRISDNSLEQLKRVVSEKTKLIEKIGNDSYDGLIKLSNQFKTDLDARLQDTQRNITEETNLRIDHVAAQVNGFLDDLKNRIIDYKNSTTEQVSSFQIEMGKKLGEVTHRFEEMKQRFKKITEQLQ